MRIQLFSVIVGMLLLYAVQHFFGVLVPVSGKAKSSVSSGNVMG